MKQHPNEAKQIILPYKKILAPLSKIFAIIKKPVVALVENKNSDDIKDWQGGLLSKSLL